MKKLFSGVLTALCLSAAAMGAQAANVTLTGWTFGSGNVVDAASPVGRYNGLAGGFSGSLSGTSGYDTDAFATYCIELEEHFSFSRLPMTSYTVVSGASYFQSVRGDASIADRLGQLMTYVADNTSLVSTSAGSTSLQLAIWNLVYDHDYSVTSKTGAFRDGTLYSPLANTLLAGAQGVTNSRFSVYALQSAGTQDFLLLAPVTPRRDEVPEPATLALAGLALGAAVMAGRRRTRAAR